MEDELLLSSLKNMASLVNKTLRVKIKNNNDLKSVAKKIKVNKDTYQNKYMSIEDVYFNKFIGSKLPDNYNEKELYLAKRLYKCLVVKIYNAKDMSINKKKVYLDEYNWENLKSAIIDTVDYLKKGDLTDRNIVCADITRIPFDNLFYNFEIKAKDEKGNEIIKSLETIITFATGKVQMGYQKGLRDENGNTTISEFELSDGESDKCYVTINFIRDYTPSIEKLDETITIYYYLGNGTMN